MPPSLQRETSVGQRQAVQLNRALSLLEASQPRNAAKALKAAAALDPSNPDVLRAARKHDISLDTNP